MIKMTKSNKINHILVICDYGEARSVAMAQVLRNRGYHAISIGTECYNFQSKLLDFKPREIVWMSEGSNPDSGWIGRDDWGDPKNKELIKLCEDKADEMGFIKNGTR